MTALLVTILAAAVAAFVLAPLFRPDAAEAERVSRTLSEAEDLQSQREMALSALRDLEDDRQTGKIGDADYAEMKTRLAARAADVLERLDRLHDPSGQVLHDGPGAAADPATGRNSP